jgi:hypothetical protein
MGRWSHVRRPQDWPDYVAPQRVDWRAVAMMVLSYAAFLAVLFALLALRDPDWWG